MRRFQRTFELYCMRQYNIQILSWELHEHYVKSTLIGDFQACSYVTHRSMVSDTVVKPCQMQPSLSRSC